MEDTLSDIWILDVTKFNTLLSKQSQEPNSDFWQMLQTNGEAPGKISNHKACAIANVIYIYGGVINNDTPKQSLYSFDVSTSTWKHIICDVILSI